MGATGRRKTHPLITDMQKMLAKEAESNLCGTNDSF